MFWKKNKIKSVAKITEKQIIYDNTRLGLLDLTLSYYNTLEEDKKHYIGKIFLEVTKKSYESITIADAIESLEPEHLLPLQKAIENEYKIVRH